MSNILMLSISLLFIVVSSNLFCNALEHLGERLVISEGVTGSIFAAIGTALPETIIPILAILSWHTGNANHEIGIGAILGAPLMLSTLSLCIMALSVIKTRGLQGVIRPENTGVRHDLEFFFIGYSLSFVAIFIQKLSWHMYFNFLIAVLLGFNYFIYLLITIKASKHLVASGYQTKAINKLTLQYIYIPVNYFTIVLQVVLSVMMLIYFAGLFIDSVNNISSLYNLSPFLLSLIIIPIATELPEKINSILWIKKGKDTLAIGNITGAMVFQGSLLPIIGILFTDWRLTSPVHMSGIIITFIATLWFYFNIRRHNIRVWNFLLNGILYIVNIIMCSYFFY